MDFEAFLESTRAADAPPAGLGAAPRALWHARRGDWDAAHGLVQDAGGPDVEWVHAHLHRIEGDMANSEYWYRRCGRQRPQSALDEEWESIARRLLADEE